MMTIEAKEYKLIYSSTIFVLINVTDFMLLHSIIADI